MEIPRPAPRVPPATTAILPSNGRSIEPPLNTPKNHTPYNAKRLPYDVYLDKEVVRPGTRESWRPQSGRAPEGRAGVAVARAHPRRCVGAGGRGGDGRLDHAAAWG